MSPALIKKNCWTFLLIIVNIFGNVNYYAYICTVIKNKTWKVKKLRENENENEVIIR
jgi:hypothetical protein